jgi:hypothetical protein
MLNIRGIIQHHLQPIDCSRRWTSRIARSIVVSEKGRVVHVSGTSASAPIFASLIAAVNDTRLAAGKGPVGSSSRGKSFFPSSGCELDLLQLYSTSFAGAFTMGSNPVARRMASPLRRGGIRSVDWAHRIS